MTTAGLTVGLIGGIGPESTIDYYRQILALRPGASVLINSVDLQRMISLFPPGNHPQLAAYLIEQVRRLAGGGADFAAIAANTPHVVFNEVAREAPIPMISIVQVTLEAAQAHGVRRAGLFGTRFTMQARFYADAFAAAGMEVVTPAPEEQDYIHERYFADLVNGRFPPETRARLLAIADAMIERDRIEALILGGTELPLILRDESHHGIPLLDTTKIHVAKIVQRLGG